MTAEERQSLRDEWERNEARIQELPDNHAERAKLERRQDEIEYALGLDDLKQKAPDSGS